MNEQFDLIRIFIGDATLVTLLEIAFRTTVLFVFTIVVMRMIGHRGIGQLSMAEFVLILALGSAVGDPMFYADIPLIYGMLVILLIAAYQIILTKLTQRSDRFSTMMDGSAIRLVADGMLDFDGCKQARLSRHEVLAELRHSGTAEMGEIHRAYLEIDGKISVLLYPENEAKPGLSILPEYVEAPVKWSRGETFPKAKQYACSNCGYTHEFQAGVPAPNCPRCHTPEWEIAVPPSSAGPSADVAEKSV